MRAERLNRAPSDLPPRPQRQPPTRKAREKGPKKFIACTIIATIFLAFVPALATAPSEEVRVIIVFKERPNAALIAGLGGEVIAAYRIIPGLAARVPAEALEGLRRNPAVAYVELDKVVHALGQQVPWGIDRIGAPGAWSISTGAGVKVAILDTGIQPDHPDLAANVKGGISLVGSENSADPARWNDGHGHGTHVAGIAAAVNNDIGVVGAAPAAWLYAVKVLADNGEGYLSDVIEGIDWSVQNGMQVLNMSYGSSDYSQAERDACDRAYSAGLLLVAAAGNEGDGDPTTTEYSYPAAYDSVIAVGATDINDQAPSWSNSGPFVELAAPGVGVYSTYKGSTYATLSGTSMAAPHVSGTAALLWARSPSLTNSQVRSILQQTAQDLGPAGRDNVYGYGLVRADRAIETTITVLRPNASGQYTEYSTVYGAAEHWDAVDDVAPDEDNTYVATATAGHRDVFNLDNSGLPDVPVSNVRVYARARKTTAAATKINLIIRTHDNDYMSEDIALTTSYATYYRDWSANPFTGGSWTASEVDALQAGVRSASSKSHRVTQVYVEVTHAMPIPPTAPTLISPADGAKTNDNRPTFKWTPGANADNHRLLVDDDLDFSSPEVNVLLGAADNSYTPTAALADENYSWKVVAINAYGENSSDVWTLIIDTTPPERPTLVSPENSKLDNKLQQAFSWTQPEPNVAYHIQIDDEPSFSSPFVHENSAVADNWYAFTFAVDGVYYWRVRAGDNANNWGPWADNFKLVIDTTPPAAPVPIWPANGENINDNSPNLDWGAVSDASPPVLYRAAVSDSPTFQHENRSSGWIEDDNWKVSPALPEGVWYWRVQVRDNAGNIGENSATRSFRVDVTSPPAPALLEPADGAMTTDNTPTFRWAIVVDNSMPVTYGLQVDNDPDFSSPEIDVSGLADNSYMPTVGLPFENYSWRVQARDNAGNASAWSSVRTLLIVAARGVEVTISPSENSGAPGATLTYKVTVRNTGNVEDNYVLTVNDNLGWEPTLSDNYLTIPAGENGTAALAVAVPENTTSGMEDNITVIAASLSDNEVSAAASCIARAESASVEFDLATLYEVGLSVSARLTEGSKLVVKFYTYAGSYQGENVVWSGPTPDNVNFSITVPHPGNKAVEKVRLDLTYDNTENVILTMATFTVTRGVLWDRLLGIKGRWLFADPDERDALWSEILAIKGQWLFAPA